MVSMMSTTATKEDVGRSVLTDTKKLPALLLPSEERLVLGLEKAGERKPLSFCVNEKIGKKYS